MSRRREAGFTIIEVLLAVVMLSIGVLALGSTSGTITRMLSGGKLKTNAGALAVSVLDSLRYRAYATTPQCTNLTAGTTTRVMGRYSVVSVISSGTESRTIQVRVTYRNGRRVQADTVRTILYCQ